MVYEKKQSGDPDFDDKVPADMHGGLVVTAGDGRTVLVNPSTGPTDVNGQHVSLDDPKGDEADNRPAPGEVATKPSEVQTYEAKDLAPYKDAPVVNSQEELEALGKKDETEDSKGVAPKAAPAKPKGTAVSGTGTAK
jgi:hypothetical protein